MTPEENLPDEMHLEDAKRQLQHEKERLLARLSHLDAALRSIDNALNAAVSEDFPFAAANPELDLRNRIPWPERIVTACSLRPDGATAAEMGEIILDSSRIEKKSEEGKKIMQNIRMHVFYANEKGLIQEIPSEGKSKKYIVKK